MATNIGIYIYDKAEVLDFSGPFEVFSTANRLSQSEQKPFQVFLIAQKDQLLAARGGFQVLPHYGFDNHPSIDLLMVVGGEHQDEMKKPEVINWIRQTAKQASLVTSVCTGAFLLAQAGLLESLKVTTHWEDIPALQQQFSDLQVVHDQRWVDQNHIVTSGGISAGIDMSLYLVSRLTDKPLALKTARQMEFDWTTNNQS